MKSPKIGRFYTWRDENFYRVTEIINGGIPKPALMSWGIKMVAEGAVEAIERGILAAMVEQDRGAAVSWLKALPWSKKERAAELGTYLHSAIEAHVLGQPFPAWPVLAKPRMAQFERFLARYNPGYSATEMTVYNRTHRYAGTVDAIALIGNRSFLIDMKSGKAIYPEVALQLSAYRYAEFTGLPDGSEAALPPIDACAVLHLQDDGFSFREITAGPAEFRFFLYAREIFRWQIEHSKTVIREEVSFLKALTKNLEEELLQEEVA